MFLFTHSFLVENISMISNINLDLKSDVNENKNAGTLGNNDIT